MQHIVSAAVSNINAAHSIGHGTEHQPSTHTRHTMPLLPPMQWKQQQQCKPFNTMCKTKGNGNGNGDSNAKTLPHRLIV